MFKKILIANRGEIACRVIRTARRMGVATVAVYSDADARALHVEMADDAVHIGAAPVGESYLRDDRIVAAAINSRAEAVHPGYGFLSENPDFVDQVTAAGLVFIGPSAASIRLILAVIAGNDGDAGTLHERLGFRLAAHRADRRRRRSDEDQPSGSAGLREGGAFGEEAITRVDRLGAALAGRLDEALDRKIALSGRPLADQNRLVRLAPMRPRPVRLGEDGDRAHAHPPRGPHDPAGDLAAIGDQERGEHRSFLGMDGPAGKGRGGRGRELS
jgi:hypothetical protein